MNTSIDWDGGRNKKMAFISYHKYAKLNNCYSTSVTKNKYLVSNWCCLHVWDGFSSSLF